MLIWNRREANNLTISPRHSLNMVFIGQQIFLKSLLENEDMGLIEGATDSVSIWSKAIGITR